MQYTCFLTQCLGGGTIPHGRCEQAPKHEVMGLYLGGVTCIQCDEPQLFCQLSPLLCNDVFNNDWCALTSWGRIYVDSWAARSPPIEIDIDVKLWTTTYSASGEYFVSGGDGVRVWRVEDGNLKQLATMKAEGVQCLAVSKDGKWIAAGTASGKALLWDTKTFEPVWTFKKRMQRGSINGVDFSPDSTRLISASSTKSAVVWDIALGKQVQTLRHKDRLTGAKYSPEGDRIATTTPRSIRVWDSNSGCLLLDRNVTVTPEYNTGLLWFGNDHLLVVLDSTIRKFETSFGSVVSEWPVSDTDSSSCIALPKHGEFIAYSTKRTLTFWDTSTHTRLGLVQHPQDIRSLSLSPDDRFIAIGRESRKITIRSLSPFAVSIVLLRMIPT